MTGPPGSPLRTWFEAAFDQPASGRKAWLAAHCEDPDLRAQVESLLANSESAGTPMLDRLHAHFAVVDAVAECVAVDWSGRVLGGYRLERCIGEGGMSVVYRAQAIGSAITRPVAVKILRIGMHAEDRQKAFRREREALSRLDHPNIARLLDGGIAEGLPYLVIDYIEGEPLTTHARAQALSLRARLALFATVCRAVEFAHRQLVVHRDLKPSNVLVTSAGEVRLLDFGIAKLLDSEEATTRTAHVAFTPDYAAPEQLANDAVSTATDVFALGVVLHELLTGVRPERGWTTRPSVIATRIGNDELPAGLQLRALRAGLVGDLDNVILKAIETEPQRRYGSAGAFADDIERYLDGQPVAAHPPSRWYRTRKFVQRHRGAVSLSAALAVALVASLAVAVQQGREAAQQAHAAQLAEATARAESTRANAVRDYLLGIFKAAQEQLPTGQRPTPQQLAQAAADRLESATDIDDATRAALHAAFADINATMSAHEEAAAAYARATQLLAALPSQRREWLAYSLRRAYSLNAAGHNTDAVALAAPLVAELRTQDDEAGVAGLVAWTDILLGAARFDEAIASADDVAARAQQLPDRSSAQARFRTLLPGWTRVTAGRPGDAAPLLQRALDAWRSSDTPKDAEFAGALATLSMAKYQIGQKAEARGLLEEALTLARSIFTAPHERIAGMLESLSVLDMEQGKVDAAASSIAEARSMYTALFGPSHPQVLSARLSAATIDWERVGVARAIDEYRAIATICTETGQDASNHDCPRVWQNLSNALLQDGQLDAALGASDQALALRRAMFGEEHPQYAIALAGRGVILIAQGKDQEAMQWNDRALDLLVRAGAGRGIVAGNLQRNRSIALRHLRRHDEALQALDAASAIFAEYARDDHARSADLHGLRALIYSGRGESAAARAEAELALKLDVTLAKSGRADRSAIRELATARD